MGKPRKVDNPKQKGGKASGWAPEIMPKHRKSLPNGRQQSGAFGAAPRGGASRRPLGFCCLRFGKDFLCFGMISGAHSGSILYFSFFFSREGLFLLPRCSQPGPTYTTDRVLMCGSSRLFKQAPLGKGILRICKLC